MVVAIDGTAFAECNHWCVSNVWHITVLRIIRADFFFTRRIKMKFLSVTILAILASAGFAAEMPIVSKANYHGFGPPEMRQYEKCDVYADRVEITREAGAVKIKEVRQLSGAADLLALATEAAGDREVSARCGRCDGPTTTITAYSPASPDGVILYFTGACSRDSVKRDGAGSRMLIWIVDGYCPETFSIPIPH